MADVVWSLRSTSTQCSPSPAGGNAIDNTGVAVGNAVGVSVGVWVGVAVGVLVGVAVGVAVGVGVGAASQVKPVPKQPVTAISATTAPEKIARNAPATGDLRRLSPFSDSSSGGSLMIGSCPLSPTFRETALLRLLH